MTNDTVVVFRELEGFSPDPLSVDRRASDRGAIQNDTFSLRVVLGDPSPLCASYDPSSSDFVFGGVG